MRGADFAAVLTGLSLAMGPAACPEEHFHFVVVFSGCHALHDGMVASGLRGKHFDIGRHHSMNFMKAAGFLMVLQSLRWAANLRLSCTVAPELQ